VSVIPLIIFNESPSTRTCQGMGIIWEEAVVAAQNRSEWCQCMTQCIHLDVG